MQPTGERREIPAKRLAILPLRVTPRAGGGSGLGWRWLQPAKLGGSVGIGHQGPRRKRQAPATGLVREIRGSLERFPCFDLIDRRLVYSVSFLVRAGPASAIPPTPPQSSTGWRLSVAPVAVTITMKVAWLLAPPGSTTSVPVPVESLSIGSAGGASADHAADLDN
jgi:hypothetical protein